MARLLSIGLVFLVVASYAQNLTRLEYFIDTDPGYGSGTQVTITPGTTVTDVTFDVPIDALPLGIHHVYFRIKDDNLTWGQTFSTLIYKESIILGDVPEDFVKAEFFIDTDPGFGLGTDIPVPAQGTLTNFDFVVPLDAVPGGLHIVYFRLKSASKVWSQTFSTVVYKELSLGGDVPPDITKAEYFIDTDPGFGQGTDVPVTPGGTLNNVTFAVPVNSVSQGIHTVYVRLKNANKVWSQTIANLIYKESIIVGDPAPDIKAAEYFIDTDPGFGSATSIPITPGTITDFDFTVPLGSVSSGVHTVYTRIKDANHTWSSTYTSIIYKENITSLSLPNINKLEFFVDTDPGYGNGTDIPLTPSALVTDVNFAVDVTGLVEGNHNVYIRGKDADDHWGIVIVKNFSVCQHPGTVLSAATNVTATAFDLSWAVVPGSVSYQLDVSTDNFNTFVSGYNAKSIPSNTTSVTGVTHASDYQVRVRAVATCASVHSNVIDVTTPLSTPPSQPSSITFTFITTNSYTVQYTGASGSPTGYLLVRKEGSSPAFVPQTDVAYAQGDVLSDGIVAYYGTGLTFNETGLTPNTEYFYDVFSYNQAGAFISYRTTSPLESSVRTVALEPAAQPTAIVFSTVTDTSFDVEFTASAGGADGYIAIRAAGTAPVSAPVDGVTYTTVMGSNTVAYQGADPFFSQAGLASNTHYYYAVFAYNGAGAGINYFETTPLTGDVTTPISPPSAQPTSLLFLNVTTGTYDVSFTATSAAGYLVIRKTGSSPTFAPQTNVAYSIGDVVGDGVVAYVGTGTTFSETSLTAETTYYYDIFAYNESGPLIGYRGFSPLEGSVTTLVEEPTETATGLLLSAIATTSMQVDFVPSASSTASLVLRSSGAESIYLPIDGLAYTVGDVVSDVTVVFNGSGNSFIDNSLSPGIVYYYRVFAYNGAGASASYLSTVNAGDNSKSAITVPDKPVLLASVSVDQDEFTVNWNAVTGAVDYRIDVSTDAFVTRIAGFDDFTVTSTSIALTGLQSGVEYTYRVRAVNGSGTSVNSDPGTQITVPATPVISAATGVGQTQFTLNWVAVTGASEYSLDVSYNDFSTFLAGFDNKSVTTNSAQVTGLTPGLAYQYRVRAHNDGGTSLSSGVTVQLTLPETPAAIDASQINSTNFKANWEAVDNVTEYRLDVTLTADNFSPSLANYTDLPVIGSLGKIVTGLLPTTEYTYRVRAANAAGSSPNSVTVPVTTLAPGAGLGFNVIPGGVVFTTESINVSVEVTSGVGPYTYTLFYRKISEANFQSTTSGTNPISNSTFDFSLTQSMADELGLEFYVYVINEVGADRNSQRYFIRKTLPAAGTRLPFEKSGGTVSSYELFSIPYKLDDETIATIFDEMGAYEKHRWRLLRYQGGQNVDYGAGLSKIELGKGYWFNSLEKADVVFSGGSTAPDVSGTSPFVMTLEPLWNQIGNPFPFDVDWDDILADPLNAAVAASLSPEITIFNATDGTLIIDTQNKLRTGGGGFIHADAATTLLLPVSLKNSAGRTKQSERFIQNAILDDERWLVPIGANINGVSSHVMSVGMHPDALISKDKFDDVVPPRFMNYIELYSYHEEFLTPKFSRDVVPTVPGKAWDLVFESNLGETIELFWPSQELGNGQARLFLVDLSSGRWVDMKASSSYSFKNSGSHHLKVVYGISEEYVDMGVNLLGMPYPNPFESQLTIPFVVYQAPAQINIAVYDMLGRKVAQPVDAEFGRGIHEARWDGSGPDKSSMPPGVYFCRMAGGTMVMTERIIKK